MRKITRLTLLAAVAALAVGAGTTGAVALSSDPVAEERGKSKPSILLVHGAFADASSWGDVPNILRRGGYQVRLAAVPLRGLADDQAYLNTLLDKMENKTLVVGHSYGGAVISGAKSKNLAGLAYVTAFAPDKTESVSQLDKAGGGPTSNTTNPIVNVQPYPLPTGQPLEKLGKDQDGNQIPAAEVSIQVDKFAANFAQDVWDKDRANTFADGQRPISVASLAQTQAGEPAWKTAPTSYLVADDDHMIPPKGKGDGKGGSEFMANRIKAANAKTRIEHSPGSHLVMVSQSWNVAEFIKRSAKHAGL
ncbi:alpha/beta hydrolase [Pseudonocardiaceae bacterium YIM PH 21723]|nr:alpha/beta hydrolase [Pseudonocardiaceae bacterium YIM PH 21723]